MTPTSDKITSGGPFSPDVTPATGKPVLADLPTPAEVEVALGDDAEGAIGSDAPAEAQGVDTGERR